jgi:hypothetical protein
MFLKPAVKESRGKAIAVILAGYLRGASQTHFVAPAAPFLLLEDNATEKSLQGVIGTPPDFQVLFLGKTFEGLPAADIFQVWVDIGIKE